MKYNSDDIKTILTNSQYQPSINYVPFFQVEIVEDTSQVTFVNEHVDSLVKLYVQLSPKDKDTFTKDISDYIDIGTNPFENITTGYNFLLHNNQSNIAFKKLVDTDPIYKNSSAIGLVCSLISDVLKNEWHIIPRDQIDYLYKWSDDTINTRNELGSKIRSMPSIYISASTSIKTLHKRLNIIKMMDLKSRIFTGTNDEINNDQKALKNEFKKHNFPTDLSEVLDRIDYKIATASNNFDFKDVIGTIRSFTERLFQYIAITINNEDGQKVDEKDSEAVAKFFIKNKLISEDQGKMIIALRHFLSNEGVHRLKSRPDDARLCRNMTVEIALYLVFRMNDLNNL